MNTFNNFLQHYINSPETNIDYGIPTKVFCIMTFMYDVRIKYNIDPDFYILELKLDSEINLKGTNISYYNISPQSSPIVFEYNTPFYNLDTECRQWFNFKTSSVFRKDWQEFQKTGNVPTKDNIVTFRNYLDKGLIRMQSKETDFSGINKLQFGGFGTEYPTLNDFIEKYAIPYIETRIEYASPKLKTQGCQTFIINEYVSKLNRNLQRLKQYKSN